MAALYQLTDTDAVLRTSDGALIPNDPRNRDWAAYQTWLAVPNTPDPAPVSLAEHRTRAKADVDVEADRRLAVYWPVRSGPGAFFDMVRYREALDADADGTPTAAEYPIMDAEIPHTGATIAAVADQVIADVDAYRVQAALIQGVRLDAHDDIDSAGTLAAVRAVVDGIQWPNELRPSIVSGTAEVPVHRIDPILPAIVAGSGDCPEGRIDPILPKLSTGAGDVPGVTVKVA